jgi:hypothetical protein
MMDEHDLRAQESHDANISLSKKFIYKEALECGV